MSKRLDAFTKQRDYLVCVDSDGCAMDTMVAKHYRCFGPCLVREWELEPWRDVVLAEWNQLNLYTRQRGCNRFDALARILRLVDRTITPISGIEVLERWLQTTREKSNQALLQAVREQGHTILCKALAWSDAINAAVAQLTPEDTPPFPNVIETLEAAHGQADVIVLSGGNEDAIREEWDAYGMLSAVDLMLTQDDGTKSVCLAALLEKGYAPDKVLMLGDAPGDAETASRAGVHFFPIRVRWEGEDWRELGAQGLPLFFSGSYGEYEQRKYREFMENLSE